MIPDLTTLLLLFLIINFIGTLTFLFIWRENRKRFDGIPYWLAGMFLQVVGFPLLMLRGRIPDLISMTVANGFNILGLLLILIGLEYFTGKRGRHYYNFLLLAGFCIVHGYYAVVQPSLPVREFAGSAMVTVFSIQCSWLLLRKVHSGMLPYTRLPGIVMALYALFNLIRIVLNFLFPSGTNDFLHSGAVNSLAITGYIVLSLSLIISLILMVNRRLLSDMASQEAKFTTAFHSSPYAITLVRKSDGIIFEVNDGFLNITGFQNEEVIGKTSLALNLWVNSQDRRGVAEQIRKGNEINEKEFEFRKKSGEVWIGLITCSEVIIHNEKCLVVSINDITDRRRAAIEIESKNKELLILNAQKDRFFSIIAHDIRGPLGGFMGLTEVIADESFEISVGEKKVILAQLNKSASNLYKLLENLLEWSRMQQGLIPVIREKVNLLQVVNELISMTGESAKLKGIELMCNISMEIYILADKNILQTIIRNLISNAVKFSTPGGRITLSAADLTDNTVEISVTDTGIGMNIELVNNLFRLDKQTLRKGTNGEPSTGLGLILCNDFIEKLNGKFTVNSTEGLGSTFSFSLPDGKDA